jgi:shikimate dehydrogenase
VIGSGGGARAVVMSIAERGAKEIRLVNRTLARAETLARDIGGPIKAPAWTDRNAALKGAALVVNTTSQGMVGQGTLDIDLAQLPTTAIVSDIVYIPRETPLLEAARKRGNPTVNGLGMLLHQARPAWEAWFGISPDVTPELRQRIEASL